MSEKKFRNMDELKDYLDQLEDRVDELYAREKRFPKTNLFSPDFLKRAFSIWGHYFVANLLIGAIIGTIGTIAYVLIAVIMVGTLFGGIRKPIIESPEINVPGITNCIGIPGIICYTYKTAPTRTPEPEPTTTMKFCGAIAEPPCPTPKP